MNQSDFRHFFQDKVAAKLVYARDLAVQSHRHHRPPPQSKNPSTTLQTHQTHPPQSWTPKVEPQEKKKTPKGRAKKRLTYTRRFVNVTMTGGKRKMNPNPTS
ncbi:40S ribosomal protein S30-B [Parastagonospora nodorum]|nr:40S ribosomal protein S30-B [Parastagonospora nodorum]KAH3928328.1 40S ribosomal protein S30-B [Parastagonospora nodorum]KAH3945304.1 40S ribosomal protein S30-B [Parastagonospora nodorum]KAH4029112.1 40S ribosomal protein S30-B [Parastagonospora nodorum]KAH4038004.1 40S ribosomal protein S30-B [Parastagonospora nodorum]